MDSVGSDELFALGTTSFVLIARELSVYTDFGSSVSDPLLDDSFSFVCSSCCISEALIEHLCAFVSLSLFYF
ncbi:unnamed protein product [Linum trigynum]|uniref:Uncharacterized protein n=1 Tax=Linum trigynum TaxID=586398 RepID=A0AAV2DC16_9ROSI